MQTDVLIVGGGPAGLATAIAASRKGLRVVLIDHRSPPIDKACGEGLLPEAVAVLGKLGIEFDSDLAHPFVGLRFSDGPLSASAHFAQGSAFGIRRTILHRLLVERAREAGVTMLWQTGFSGFESGVVRAGNETIACRWLVGADGQHSRVRQFTRLDSRAARRHRFGFRRHYAAAPWTSFVDVYWVSGAQLVVTPTGAGEVCLSMLTSNPRLRTDAALASFFPEVAHRLEGARTVSNEVGAVTSLGRARFVACGNVALVGDSSCTVDGIAGQGLSLAFLQALALAESLATGDLSSYQAAHARIVRTPMRMARLLMLMNASGALRKRAMKLFARKPELFARLVAAHTSPPSQHGSIPAEILDLGWNLLWER
jgi:flavin-dependent dehydrogenase